MQDVPEQAHKTVFMAMQDAPEQGHKTVFLSLLHLASPCFFVHMPCFDGRFFVHTPCFDGRLHAANLTLTLLLLGVTPGVSGA